MSEFQRDVAAAAAGDMLSGVEAAFLCWQISRLRVVGLSIPDDGAPSRLGSFIYECIKQELPCVPNVVRQPQHMAENRNIYLWLSQRLQGKALTIVIGVGNYNEF